MEAKVSSVDGADWVSLPGFAANPFAYMAHCGAFVLSSRFEGLPGVLIQAMACRATVISTDCPSGPREVLEDGKYGKLVSIGDSQSMASAILDALAHPEPPPPEAVDRFRTEVATKSYLALIS